MTFPLNLNSLNSVVNQINTLTSDPYTNLALNIIALAAAMYIVWYLYKKISKRDMFKFEEAHYGKGITGQLRKVFSILFYIIKYGILFPIYSFLMFVLLSISIFFLSTGMNVHSILYISMVIISVVRLLAYINEDTAQELSKMLPFGLIFFILTKPNVAKQYTLPNINEVTTALPQVQQYFIFLIGLEFGLRIVYVLITLFVSSFERKNRKKEKDK